jgi:hypothetical protein
MAITNPDFIYVPKYDIYVQRSTRTFWKRCNRGRKTEITEDELVLMDKFTFCTTEYINLQLWVGSKKCGDCISYVFAEAFPELVGNADLHAKYPHLYTELNHKNHVHNTWESNYPENLEWQIPSVNRADTSRNVEKNNPDDKRLRHSKRMKDYYQKKKQDPEWVAKRRKHDAEYRTKQYHERRPLRKQQEEQLAAQLQSLAGLQKQQADEKHQLAD